MAIESKDLLVAVKAFSRANPLPLDASEVHDSMGAAETYAASAKAYAGQMIQVLVDGAYIPYVLNGEAAPYELTPVFDAESVDTKNYVQIVDALPAADQEQGVIYITTADNKGQIWNGTEWVVVFESIEGLNTRVGTLEGEMDTVEQAVEDLDAKFANYAPINNPVFTGTVTLAADPSADLEAATKQYVDRLVENLVSCAPGVLNASNPLPAEYKAGQTWRVTEAGSYGGHVLEVGDLVIAVEDNGETIAVQANVDGVVTGPEAATDANIVVFDGITGKKIADSNVTIASVSEVITWVNEHKEVLGTYDVTKDALLEAAAATAQEKANAAQSAAVEAAGTAADQKIATALADYYTKTEVDGLLSPINTQVGTNTSDIATLTAAVNGKIGSAELEARLGEINTDTVKEYIDQMVSVDELNARLGAEIPEGTSVAQYIDTAVGAGGTASAEAIANAKQEAINAAKTYTDEQVANIDLSGYATKDYADQAEADAVATAAADATSKADAAEANAKAYVDNALTIITY